MIIIIMNGIKRISPGIFEQFQEHFLRNVQKYEKPIKGEGTSLVYPALFGRSALLVRDQIDLDPIFANIKSVVLSPQKTLNPRACTLLMQIMKFMPFQGNETKCLEKLCDYAQNYFHAFTYEQQHSFYKSYLYVMGQKSHSTVKFIPLNEQKHTPQQKLNTFYNLPPLHPKISSVCLLSEQEMSYMVNIDGKKVKVKVMAINQCKQSQQYFTSMTNFQKKIKPYESVILNFSPNEERKINLVGQIEEKSVLDLLTEKNFRNGLYFDNLPKNMHEDGVLNQPLSLLLGLPPRSFNKKSFYINQLPPQSILQCAQKYFSWEQVQECSGYVCLSHFHDLFCEAYMKEYQTLENPKSSPKVGEVHRMEDMMREVEQMKQQKEVKFMKQSKLEYVGLLADEKYWGLRQQIWHAQQITKIIQQKSKKCEKVLIVTEKKAFLPLVRHLLESRFFRIPPYGPHKKEAKSAILSVLFNMPPPPDASPEFVNLFQSYSQFLEKPVGL